MELSVYSNTATCSSQVFAVLNTVQYSILFSAWCRQPDNGSPHDLQYSGNIQLNCKMNHRNVVNGRTGTSDTTSHEDVRVGRCTQCAFEREPRCDEGAGISDDVCVVLSTGSLSAQVLTAT